jgi:hypothetical protein
MALTVAPLAGFPAINTFYQRTAGTPTITENPAHGSYTSGVYTQSGTQYVAAILDAQGINPSRVFFADNDTGSGTTGATVVLPKLVSVTQVSAHGQSIQNLDPSTFMYQDKIGYAGFVVVLNATPASADDGVYPLGYDNATVLEPSNTPGWTTQGGAYTNAAVTVGYPNPQMRFFVSMQAMLILASTSTG